MKDNIIGRFAPSPSGRMHLGNVYSALLSWLSAKSQGGQWILRIEDLDPQRCKREYAVQLEDDLRWLGLDWDAGGIDHPDYVQSLRGDVYSECLARLTSAGYTYPCYCSRADILATQAPHESDGRVVYRGTCRPDGTPEKEAWLSHRAASCPHPPATRLRVPDREISFVDGHYGIQSVNLAQSCGDFILRRADGAWAYQLAVVVDDAMMGVTEVVRGRDLLLSVPQQLYLYELLGFRPPKFAHLPLLCNAEGQRLCKRDRSLHLGILRQQYSPQEIIGQIAFLAHLIDRPEPLSARELLPHFRWESVPLDDIVLDATLVNNSPDC
ncbi:MAG: tRNA glutamyl-Q(34) synthetase GluQRS [Bacteroidales bacterium]|nr:tRNA glutamyl-Q(34) synthetase GluQRS [Bacteroidales bacterium]